MADPVETKTQEAQPELKPVTDDWVWTFGNTYHHKQAFEFEMRVDHRLGYNEMTANITKMVNDVTKELFRLFLEDLQKRGLIDSDLWKKEFEQAKQAKVNQAKQG